MNSSLMNDQEYFSMYKTEEKLWWYQALRSLLNEYVKKNYKKGEILDAGCGTGKTIEELNSKGYKSFGIDLSPHAIKLSKLRNVKNIKVADIKKIPYKDETFEIVLCMDVLGSIRTNKEIKVIIKEFHRVLKKEGILIVHCAAFEWLRSPHDTVTNFRKRFRKSELERFFKKEWVIKKSSYRVFLIFPLIVFFRIYKKIRYKNKPITDQHVPIFIVNYILLSIQKLENFLLRYTNFPFGSSIFIVVRKKD